MKDVIGAEYSYLECFVLSDRKIMGQALTEVFFFFRGIDFRLIFILNTLTVDGKIDFQINPLFSAQ